MTVAYGAHPIAAVDLGEFVGSRLVDTEYHNNSNRPLMLVARYTSYVDGDSATDQATPVLHMRATSGGANITLGFCGISKAGNAIGQDWAIADVMTVIIPANYYYIWTEIVSAGCTVTLQSWREIRL